MATTAPSESQVRQYLQTLSNWGRWGSYDDLGTINLITPAKQLAAARLVCDGVSVTCARPIATDIAADTTFQPVRFMVDSGEGRDTASPERQIQRRGASEFIGMVFHGFSITHVDAPSHYFWDGQLYNGRSCNLVTSREGATVASIETLRDGVVSRGVLLDVGRARGGRGVPGGEGVMPEELEAAERAAGVRVEPGDILLVRPATTVARLRTARCRRCRRARPRSTSRAARGCASAAWRWWAAIRTTTCTRRRTRRWATRFTSCAWSRWASGSSTTRTSRTSLGRARSAGDGSSCSRSRRCA